MASGVQSVYPQIPPPPYAQHGQHSSMNGSFSQQTLGSSFNAGQSVQSTPAPSAQPPRPGSQQMSYGMNGDHGANGMMPPNNYGGYPDPNLFNQTQYYNNTAAEPSIYSAVYSNVSVFEMEVNGIAVMRRRTDGWLNATQILKVAGVDKGKRTKVLEKEVQTGQHEKVQGGYGKYQGTWINYQRGREFCRQYGVENLLLPLLEHDLSADGGSVPQGMETPTKEQAMAAQRKRMYGGESRPNSQSQGGTFFKNMSSTAANAINALNRTRVDSPNRVDGRRSVGGRRPSQSQYGQDQMYGSQQSMHSMVSHDSFGNSGVMSQGASFADFPANDLQEPPRKRIRPSPANSFVNNNAFDGAIDMSMQDGSPTEANQSFLSQHGQSFGAQPLYHGLEPLQHPNGPLEEQKKELLLDLFLDPSRGDFDDHPAFMRLSGDEFELPIDGSCNTAMHWAATLARVHLVRKLLEKGFNMRRTNSGGETALIAACQARNNLDQSTFPALLELLGPSIDVRDGRGRTLLHHIAVSSAMKGRAAVGRYYLESLLEYVVRQGSVSNTHNPNPMTLARFMSEIVNAQDKAGDTALNLAARTSTTTIIDQLIEVGADPHIVNRGGLAPIDFGVGGDSSTHHHESGVASFHSEPGINGTTQNSFEEAQEGLLTSIREILSQSEMDFTTELKEKQETLDKTNAALKESGAALAEERKRLEELRAKAREKDELTRKIANLKVFLAQLKKESGDAPDAPTPNIKIGDADKGLDFNGSISRDNLIRLFPTVPWPEDHESFDPETSDLGSYLPSVFNAEQAAFFAQMENDIVLRGRVQAYRIHNAGLENQVKALTSRSSDLEERYKKIVCLCTGCSMEDLDNDPTLIDKLIQAVVSEQKDMSGTAGLAGGGDGMSSTNVTPRIGTMQGQTTNNNADGPETLELKRVRDFLRSVKPEA